MESVLSLMTVLQTEVPFTWRKPVMGIEGSPSRLSQLNRPLYEEKVDPFA